MHQFHLCDKIGLYLCPVVCVQCVDYSDDETERRVKAKLRMRGNVKDDDSATDEDSNELNSNDDSNSPKKMAACRQLKQ